MEHRKRRFVVAGGVIVAVVIVLLAVMGSSGAAQAMSVAEATQPDATGKRVQVTGTVVGDSFTLSEGILDFSIEDPDEPGAVLAVSYDKGVSATFGNGVEAICTGTVDDSGVLQCSELVTKCPSKYETATDALGVAALLDYGEDIFGTTVKVAGIVEAGSIAGVQEDVRFVLVDADDAQMVLPVAFAGALSDEVADGSSLVLTGSLGSDGVFEATDVALEAE